MSSLAYSSFKEASKNVFRLYSIGFPSAISFSLFCAKARSCVNPSWDFSSRLL